MGRRPYHLLQNEDQELTKRLWTRCMKNPEKISRKEDEPLSTKERSQVIRSEEEIRQAMRDLTWFANQWPEHYLQGVFEADKPNESALVKLLEAIIEPSTGPYLFNGKHIRDKARKITKEDLVEWERRRQRIVTICKRIMLIMQNKAEWLAPEACLIFNEAGRMSVIDKLEALWIGH